MTWKTKRVRSDRTSEVSSGWSHFWVRAKWRQKCLHLRHTQMMWRRHQDKLLDMKHRAGFGSGPRNYATKEAEAQCYTPTRTESQENDSLQRFHLLNVTGQFFSISSKPLPTLNIFSLFCCSAFRLLPSQWRQAVACQWGNILLPALEFRFYSQNHFKILCKPCVRVKERSSDVMCLYWVWCGEISIKTGSQRCCLIPKI